MSQQKRQKTDIDDFQLAVRNFEELCGAEYLSLKRVRAMTKLIPPKALQDSCYLHLACANEDVTAPILKHLVDFYPAGAKILSNLFNPARHTREGGEAYPLHVACRNEACDVSAIRLILAQNPAAVRHICVLSGRRNDADPVEGMPLYFYLGRKNNDIDLELVKQWIVEYPESLSVGAGIQYDTLFWRLFEHPDIADGLFNVFSDLVDRDPTYFRAVTIHGDTPINIACQSNISVRIVKLLASAWPESVTQANSEGEAPMYHLCSNEMDETTSLEILKFLIDCHPETITSPISTVYEDNFPLHDAISLRQRSTQFCKLLVQAWPESVRINSSEVGLPIEVACVCEMSGEGEGNGDLDLVRFLYDQYPEALFTDFFDIPDRDEWLEEVDDFIQQQEEYTQTYKDLRIMTTKDCNGQLPIHRILANIDASLGTAKLLVEGNPFALMVPDNHGSFPLHIACATGKADIVQFLAESYPRCLGACDKEKNSPLHIACLGGCVDVVLCLLDKQAGSSTRNIDGKLPIHLLVEAGEGKVDNESPEYTEAIWRLLRASPDLVVNW